MIRVLALYQNGQFTIDLARVPSDSSSEKKLAMILKGLLVLEAAAKVAFVVTISVTQKGSLL